LYKAYIYLCKGELREAETEFQKLLESEENSDNLVGRRGFVSLRLLQGRFEEAKSQATQGVELAEKLGEMGWKSFFHSYLSYVFLRERNFDRALQENDIALNIAVKEEFLNRQRDALLRGALIYLEMESTEKAKKAADKLKEIIDSGMNQKLLRMYYFVTGMIELERKNLARAIKNFKDALSLLAYQNGINTGHASFIEPLAFAYYKSGDLEKAYEEYERIISLTGGRTFWGDIYAKSFYMLGKIYEQKGWKGKAIEHYEKFLSLWKDADPDFLEVEDAKKRLAAL
jgi:tetratricopeptide (TPR) repeat protein